MVNLIKEKIDRIRKVNKMKRIANNSPEHKLAYYPGANLVLLQKMGTGWMVKDETGAWFEEYFNEDRIH